MPNSFKTCKKILNIMKEILQNIPHSQKYPPPTEVYFISRISCLTYDTEIEFCNESQVSHLRQSRRLPMGTAQSGSLVFTFVLMSLQHDCYDFWLFQSHCRVFTNCCLLANLPLGSKLGSASTGIPQTIYPDLTMALN
jgi:hypothetical protein